MTFTSSLIEYTISGATQESAGVAIEIESELQYDLLAFLGVAQSLKIDFLPILWQAGREILGEGGTSEVRQAAMNVEVYFAFKILRPPQDIREEYRNLRALIVEISVLGHPSIQDHPNVLAIEGICWDFRPDTKQAWPVLVFEKSKYGNLARFCSEGNIKDLGYPATMKIIADVARAVRDLNAIGLYRHLSYYIYPFSQKLVF